jgi:hypothetical protein
MQTTNNVLPRTALKIIPAFGHPFVIDPTGWTVEVSVALVVGVLNVVFGEVGLVTPASREPRLPASRGRPLTVVVPGLCVRKA